MRTRTRFRFLMALMLSGFGIAGCDESLRTIAGPTPDLEPRLSSIQQLIFDAPDSTGRAACTSCHNDTNRARAAGMTLAGSGAHASLVGVASTGKAGAVRVIPGDPENSYLVHKIEGRHDIAGQ